MHLAITICATRLYSYAMFAQARRVIACLTTDPERWKEGTVILSTDQSGDLALLSKFYEARLPAGWTVRQEMFPHKDGLPNYQLEVQRVIARMRSYAFDVARQVKADLCWSLDSDVLPPENALRCMADLLQFDNGHLYHVAACPYVSQGGGDYMGGRGTPQRPILPDLYEEERVVPSALLRRKKRLLEWGKREKAAMEKLPPAERGKVTESPEWIKERDVVRDELAKCPPQGDVFFRNSSSGIEPFYQAVQAILRRVLGRRSPRVKKPKGCGLANEERLLNLLLRLVERESAQYKSHGFKRRGWVTSAYAALGFGAIVPTDWHGFGCCLMGSRALALAQFDGYDGAGTEDLYVVWKRWHRAGLRIGLVLHAPCDHVVRIQDGNAKLLRYELHQARFEQDDPECVGHLRVEKRPWFQQTIDEA